MTTGIYNESWTSRVEEIRRNGPSIPTAVLEQVDNSFGWGEADNFSLHYDIKRMNMNIKDNGKGFGSTDAMHRFFKLGKKNSKVSAETIGKYGKGGYMGLINMGQQFDITSYFENKKHCIGTDINTMEEKNIHSPTLPLISEDYSGEECGTHINIDLLPKYHDKLDEKDMKRNLVRAYHNLPITITFQGKEIEKVLPYGDRIQEIEEYDIMWKNEENVFTTRKHINEESENEESENEESDFEDEVEILEKKCGKLSLITTMDTVRNYTYLGNGEEPGIDIYRNNRMCNSNYPIKALGKIGKNLSRGEMRGKRCHMVLEYNSIDLSDGLDMDGCVGLTSDKEISQDIGKWHPSLLKLLEDRATDCRLMYERYVNKIKESHQLIINGDIQWLSSLSKDKPLSKDIIDKVERINGNYTTFNKCGLCKFDDDTDKWTYLTGQPKDGEKISKTRKNTNLMKTAERAKDISFRIIKENDKLKKKEIMYLEIKEKHSLNNIDDIKKFIKISQEIKVQGKGLSCEKPVDYLDTLNKLINNCRKIISIPDITGIPEYKDLLHRYEGKLPEAQKSVEDAMLLAKEKAKRIAEEEEAKRIAEEEEEMKSNEFREKIKLMTPEEKDDRLLRFMVSTYKINNKLAKIT